MFSTHIIPIKFRVFMDLLTISNNRTIRIMFLCQSILSFQYKYLKQSECRTFVTFLVGPPCFTVSSVFLVSSVFGLAFFAAKSELISVGSSLTGA